MDTQGTFAAVHSLQPVNEKLQLEPHPQRNFFMSSAVTYNNCTYRLGWCARQK